MKILFFAVHLSTFVTRDIKILKSKNEVTYFNPVNYSLFNLYNQLRENDLTFFWFASIRFFIPLLIAKILKRKIIIVAGGYDVKKIESGSMGSIWKSIIVKIMLKLSDKILAVSYSNRKEIINNCKLDQSKIEMVYHGFEEIKQINLSKKTDIALTIGFIDKLSFSRKGIDRFFKLAETLPEIEFHLIGKVEMNLDNVPVPNNVILHGHLDFGQEKFISLLESAKIYIQFSKHESFGCSVAEAMQYGCIPVISDSYSLPEVVGNCGLIIKEFNDYKDIASQVRELFKAYHYNLSLECIKRVKDKFNYEVRANKIINIVNKLEVDSPSKKIKIN